VLKSIELVTAERIRQIEKEGFTLESDQQYTFNELLAAAFVYLLPSGFRDPIDELWPWDDSFFKPTPNDRVRELTKACALIMAEIDRLLAEDVKNEIQ
jgi:hypothetical protein